MNCIPHRNPGISVGLSQCLPAEKRKGNLGRIQPGGCRIARYQRIVEDGFEMGVLHQPERARFPLKSQTYIHNFLGNNRGKDFLKVANQSKVRPDTLSRIENYVTESGDDIVSTPVLKRPFLRGVTPYIGNQWMILSRKFCEFVSYSPEVDRFKKFYQNTFIADEGFFQTVIMNTSYEGTIVNDDKRAIDSVSM